LTKNRLVLNFTHRFRAFSMRSFIQKWVGRSAWEPPLRRGEADSPLGGFFLGCCGGYVKEKKVARARPSANVAHYHISARLRRHRVVQVPIESPDVLPVHRFGPALPTQEEVYKAHLGIVPIPPSCTQRKREQFRRKVRDIRDGVRCLQVAVSTINKMRRCKCGERREGASLNSEVVWAEADEQLVSYKHQLISGISMRVGGKVVCKRRFRHLAIQGDAKRRHCCGHIDYLSLPPLVRKDRSQPNAILDARYRPNWLHPEYRRTELCDDGY